MSPAGTLLLLAGGTGLAPVLSILETLAAAGTTDRAVHLIYGTSFDTDVVYTDLLDEFTTRIPGMTWDLVVADPADGTRVLRAARAVLKERFGIEHTTIQVEDAALRAAEPDLRV